MTGMVWDVFISVWFRCPDTTGLVTESQLFFIVLWYFEKSTQSGTAFAHFFSCLLSFSSSQPLTMVLKQMHVGVSMVHKFHREGPPPALLGMMCCRVLREQVA